MRFQRQPEGTVEIGAGAIDALYRYRQFEPDAPEAGGVLLGRLLQASHDVVIDEATEPTIADLQGRFSFKRARQPTQQHIIDAWIQSAGTHIYLGEWHTHPEEYPTPSRYDLQNWRYLARSATYEQESLIFVIVGMRSTRLWEVRKNQLSIYEVLLVTDETHC